MAELVTSMLYVVEYVTPPGLVSRP